MSSPIKPPRGAPPGPAPEGPHKGEGGAAEAPFRKTLERSDAADADPAVAVPTAAAEDPILRDLQAGRIEPAEAVDRMVQRALEAPAVAGLSPAMRAELEDHLRRSLSDDPSLAALARDLSRGE